MRKGFEVLGFVCLSLTAGAAGAFAQDVDSIQVTVVEVGENGTLVLDVDGRRMFGITDTAMRNALNAATDLAAAQAKLASTEALLADSDIASLVTRRHWRDRGNTSSSWRRSRRDTRTCSRTTSAYAASRG